MIVVEYPVALVLKGWHLLLTALGIGPDQSWLISLVLLVITIRALLLPLYYRQIRSGRILANLRPQIRALEATYANRHDPASRKELMAKRKELQKENNYSMADGCMPIFVLLPVIMGLYRLLIRIARPSEGLQAAHEGFGPLSSADIDSFLRAEFAGVPLPAYFRMPVDQLQFLGTTRADVLHVVLPMAIFASIFTTSNWAYTMRRNLRTLDYGSGAARFMMKFMWLIGPMIMLSPFLVSFGGPGPVAILVYWVCNNLWTTTQAVAVQKYLDHTMPYTDEFHEFTRTEKQKLVDRRREVKRAKRMFNEREMNRARLLQQGGPAEAIKEESARERAELDRLINGPKLAKKQRRLERRRQIAAARAHKKAASASSTPPATPAPQAETVNNQVARPEKTRPEETQPEKKRRFPGRQARLEDFKRVPSGGKKNSGRHRA